MIFEGSPVVSPGKAAEAESAVPEGEAGSSSEEESKS